MVRYVLLSIDSWRFNYPNPWKGMVFYRILPILTFYAGVKLHFYLVEIVRQILCFTVVFYF